MLKDIWTTGQVAKLCKVAPRTVSTWFDKGLLKGYKIPGSQDRRVPVENLRSFIKQNGMPASMLAQLSGPDHLLAWGLADHQYAALLESLPCWTGQLLADAFGLGQEMVWHPHATVILGPTVARDTAVTIATGVRSRGNSRRLVVLVPEDVADLGPYAGVGFDAVLPWTGDVAVLAGEVSR